MSRLIDAGAMLTDLAMWWESRAGEVPEALPSVFGTEENDAPERIAGSQWDQQVPPGTSNPYWEIVRQLPIDRMLSWGRRPEPGLYWLRGSGREFKVFADRFDVCSTYSWAICSPGDIAWMQQVTGGRGVVEIGAGTGYWAWQLRQAGVDVVAYDPEDQLPGNRFAQRTWTGVLRDGELAAGSHPDRVLFLSWPSYGGEWAARALAGYQGDTFIYCGEGEGGCCADDEFFKLLDEDWEEFSVSPAHVPFWGIHDYLSAYRRKQ